MHRAELPIGWGPGQSYGDYGQTKGGGGARIGVRWELGHKPGPHIPRARLDPICWHQAGQPTAAAPTWQENILQKVVMTAFADRTVVTIAVRGPLVGCRGIFGHRAGLLRLSSVSSP